jgi:hypothetical protein
VAPPTFETTLNVGESLDLEKTVTIDKGVPTTAQIDVFLLSDTTSSMCPLIQAVMKGANDIFRNSADLGDIAFGVGEYRDVGDAFVYRMDRDITPVNTQEDRDQVSNAIRQWVCDAGGDAPEANLFALQQVASTAAWRRDSTRIIVWFGDAPGHDPSGPSNVSEAQAIAALQAQNARVLALDVNRPDRPELGLDLTGQATRITAASRGLLFTGVQVESVVDEIKRGIELIFDRYQNVSLQPAGNLPGVAVSILPASRDGDFDRSVDRAFLFTVRFMPQAPGDHSFTINVMIDGGAMAKEVDLIHVRSDTKFLRCDSNDDGKLNIADAVWTVSQLFSNGPPTTCDRAADCNGDDRLDLSDAIFDITFLLGCSTRCTPDMPGPVPPPPFPDCGTAPSSLSCQSYSHCAL